MPEAPMVANDGGSSVACASKMSIVSRLQNGNCPVRSSNRITPTLYRSPRWSISSPRACSGHM